MNENFDNLQASDVFAGIFTENFKENPRCAAELGFAIILGKPIYLLVEIGTVVPETLTDIATGIEYYDGTSKEAASLAIKRFSDTIKKETEDGQ